MEQGYVVVREAEHLAGLMEPEVLPRLDAVVGEDDVDQIEHEAVADLFRGILELEQAKPTARLGKVLDVLATLGVRIRLIERNAAPDELP